MIKKRFGLRRRVQWTAFMAVLVLVAGMTALLAVAAAFDAAGSRRIAASQRHLNDVATVRQLPGVLGAAGAQQFMRATEPDLRMPGQPIGKIAGAQTAVATVVHRVPTTEPVIFITIDDGVTPDQAGLDLMRQRRAAATLFLNQVNVHKHRDYYRQWQNIGSGIQNHTLSHPRLPTMRPDQQQHEICTNANWLKTEYGATSTLFRPPYGEYNDTTRSTAGACGHKYLVHWSAVAEKGKVTYARGSMQPGEIILLHFTPDLAADIKAVFADADARGFKVGRLEDWLP